MSTSHNAHVDLRVLPKAIENLVNELEALMTDEPEVVALGWYCRGCKRNVDIPVRVGEEPSCPHCGTVHRRPEEEEHDR